MLAKSPARPALIQDLVGLCIVMVSGKSIPTRNPRLRPRKTLRAENTREKARVVVNK